MDIKPFKYNTKIIVEHLLNISNNHRHLHGVLKATSVINNNDRMWISKNHSGRVSLSDGFEEPVIFAIKSKLMVLFIISPIVNKRLYSLIVINGWNSEYYSSISMSNIINMMNGYFNYETEPLQDSVFKQLFIFAFIKDSYQDKTSDEEEYNLLMNINKIKENKTDEKVDGIMLTEIEKNLWVIAEDFYEISKQHKTMKKAFKLLVTMFFKQLL